jgi:DNA-binding response OmpR family regulator
MVSREQCIKAIWGEEGAYEVSNQALDALIRRLRVRVSEKDPDFEYIITVRGHGLRFENRN